MTGLLQRTSNTLLACGLIAAAGLPAIAAAQEDEPNRYLAFSASYIEPDDDRNVEYGTGISGLIGRQIWGNDSRWYLEGAFGVNGLETDVEGATDFYQFSLGADLVYAFDDRIGFTPFALIGGGAVYNDVAPDSEDETEAFANAGVGFVTAAFSNWNIKLRGEARYVYDSYLDGLGDVRGSIGIEIPVTKAPPAPLPPPPPPEPEIRVIEPAPLPDGDGDGVPDQYDLCPATPAGAEVNENGCAFGETIELEGVNFEFDSARLTANAEAILSIIAKRLNRFPSAEGEVAGHTDSLGPDDYNLKLSQRRAEAVKAYLVNAGVAEGRLTVQGYGETKPRADNGTEIGRELNRRVELKFR